MTITSFRPVVLACAGALLVSGCNKDAAASRPVTIVAVPVGSAPVPSSATATPTGTNQEVKLTWVLHPVLSDESQAGPERNIELVARIGNVVKRVPLGVHFGTLPPSSQSACNPELKKGTIVSVLYIHTMGPTTIVGRRVQPDLLEISWTREADDAPDEIEGTFATIPIPSDARIVDAIQIVRGPRDELPFDCSEASDSSSW